MSAREEYAPTVVEGGHELPTMVTMPVKQWELMCCEIDLLRSRVTYYTDLLITAARRS